MKPLVPYVPALVAAWPAHAANLTANDILATASVYTVKIKRTSGIGLNEDSRNSAHAIPFLVDKQRGWILTNVHVASRAPTTLSVSFKGQVYVKAKRVFVDYLADVALLEIPM